MHCPVRHPQEGVWLTTIGPRWRRGFLQGRSLDRHSTLFNHPQDITLEDVRHIPVTNRYARTLTFFACVPRGINPSSLITLIDLDVFWSARQEPPTCNKNSNLAPVLCRGSPTVVLRHRPAATRVPHPTRPFPWINSKFSAFRCISHSSLLCRRSDGVANSSGLRSHLKDAVLVKAHCTVAVIEVILNDEENRYSSPAIASSAC